MYRRPDSVKYYPNKLIYEGGQIEPIENELVKHSLKFIDREKMNDSSILKYYVKYDGV